MKKTFLFNMGYDTSHVTSVLAREGLETGSEIILLVPEEIDERQKNAITDIQNHLSNLDIETSLSKFHISIEFDKKFQEIQELIKDKENIVLSLSGGSRDILIPLSMISALHQENITKTLFRSDINSELKQIKTPKLPQTIKKNEKQVLEVLKREERLSAKQIQDKINKSDSAVYQTLRKLEEKGLVNTAKQGNNKKYSPSMTAKLLTT